MSKRKKIIIVISILVIIGVLVYIIISNMNISENNEKEENVNSQNIIKIDIESNKKDFSENLLKERTLGDFKIKDIDILIINNTSNFHATIQNIGEKIYENQKIIMIFVNSNGTELGRLEYPIIRMGPKDESEIDMCLTQDISTATDIVLEEKK